MGFEGVGAAPLNFTLGLACGLERLSPALAAAWASLDLQLYQGACGRCIQARRMQGTFVVAGLSCPAGGGAQSRAAATDPARAASGRLLRSPPHPLAPLRPGGGPAGPLH